MQRSIHADRSALDHHLTAVADTKAPAMSMSGVAFAAVMAALGVIGLIYGDVAMVWQRIPIEHLPGQRALAYAFAIVELGTGLGLLLRPFARPAAAILLVYMALWAVLLKLPAVVAVPQMEAT